MDDNHPDFARISEIEAALCDAVGSREKLCQELPIELRRALDEVIDTPRTGRIWISELEKTEKTYIGTKVEIVVRAYLELPKGRRLDLLVANHEVDVKNTVGKGSWMIPSEAVGQVCFLLAEDDANALCSAGLIVAHVDYLTKGSNRDGKRSISATGLKNAKWFFQNSEMASFWTVLTKAQIAEIMDPSVGGTERLRRLFSIVKGRPISREIVQCVARQKDYMKRLRKNGGARDPLADEGIVILGGGYGRDLLERFGLPHCGRDEFIAYQPTNEREIQALRKRSLL